MAGYARTNTADITASAVVKSAPINAELNALVTAFAFSGGHNHDGTSTEGSYVSLIADVDALNKVVIDTTNNRVGFFTEVSSSAVEQIRIQDGAIVPVTDSDIDLGTASLEFKDLYLDGTAHIDTLDVDVNATVAGTLGVTGATTLGGILSIPDGSASAPSITNTGDTNCGLFFSGADVLSFTAGGTAQFTMADGVIAPVTDSDVDLGTSSLEFKDLYLDGTAHIDTLDVDVNATVAGTLGVTGAITGASTVQGTTITATTAFVPDASDGAALGTTALEFSDLFLADGAVINLGDDQDVKLTHVADAGVLLNDAMVIQFRDSAINIGSPADGDLDINADDEIELNSTLIDVNGNLDVSGTLVVAGTSTLAATSFGDADITNVGNIALDSISADGTDINLAVTDNSATALTIKQGSDAYLIIDTANSSESVSIGTGISGTAITIGHGTSEVTVGDNLTVAGNLTVTGTTTTVSSQTINVQNAFVFEGATADAHETTLSIVDPTADRTINLPNQSGTLALLAAASNTAITSTPAELNILDGATLDVTELNTLDGITAVVGELNALDLGSTAVGTAIASKAVILDSNKDYTGIRNFTTTGTSTFANLSDGTITVTAFVDEDDMSSNSATLIPTQQSVKAYTDTVAGQANNVTGLTASGAELNVLDGASAGTIVNSKGVIYSSGGVVNATSLSIAGTDLTATAAEFNLLDGGSTVGTTTVASGDGLLTNDGGTMRQTNIDTFDTYLSATTKTLTNKTLTSPVLTSPKIVDGGFIADANGNEIIIFQTASSATNALEITNSANGAAVVIGAAGSSDSNIDIDISPKGTGEVNIAAGNLNYGSTAITSTGAELNLVDGSSAGTIVNSKAVIYSSGGVVNATSLAIAGTALTATAAEFNLLDGGSTVGTTAVADGDGIVTNDGGTMRQTTVQTFATYFASEITAMSNLVTTGALNSGSITSGFGTINTGSSAITTTGTVNFGSLADGTITVTAFVDEDNMSSDSATLVPTQQSVKKYVDDSVATAATTGKAIAMAIVFG